MLPAPFRGALLRGIADPSATWTRSPICRHGPATARRCCYGCVIESAAAAACANRPPASDVDERQKTGAMSYRGRAGMESRWAWKEPAGSGNEPGSHLACFMLEPASRRGFRPVRNESIAAGGMKLRRGSGSCWSRCPATSGRNPLCELSEMFTAERPNLASRTVGHIRPPAVAQSRLAMIGPVHQP